MIQKIKRIPQIYNNLCQKKPLQTITISTGFILGSGDLLTQYIEYYQEKKKYQDIQTSLKQNKNQQYEYESNLSIHQYTIIENPKFKLDIRRTLSMAAYGWLCYGPLSYVWYCRILPKWVPVSAGNIISNKQIFQKVLLDETIQSASFYVSFLYLLTVFEGGSHTQGVEKVQKDFITCYSADLLCWPLIQFINFKKVPPHLQSLVVSSITIFWGAFISYVQHR